MTRKMKDSGIEWIGEIPEEWETTRIGGLYSLRNTKVSDIDYQPLSVTMNGILPQLESAAKTNDHNNRKLVKKNDFVINSRSDRRGSCGISKLDGSVSLINIVLSPNSSMNPEYYNWVFTNPSFSEEFYKWGNGIVDDLWTTNWSKMKNINVPHPDLVTQKKIAIYLNTKVSSIESLLIKISKEIETLENYKKSVITEAVTKGLGKNVEMKDSGIEWIGEIPKHWDLVKIKYTQKKEESNSFIDGDWIESNYIKEDGIRYITTGNIGDGKFIVQGNGFISREDFELLRCKYAYPGDLIFSRLNAPYGRSCLLPDTYSEYVIAVDNVILRPDEYYNRKFINYLTQCIGYQQSVKDSASGTTMQRISRTKLGNIPLPFPNTEEQNDIVEYLYKKTKLIDDSIAIKQKQLETLEEYKKSLIYEYVTGKKEVEDGEES